MQFAWQHSVRWHLFSLLTMASESPLSDSDLSLHSISQLPHDFFILLIPKGLGGQGETLLSYFLKLQIVSLITGFVSFPEIR